MQKHTPTTQIPPLPHTPASFGTERELELDRGWGWGKGLELFSWLFNNGHRADGSRVKGEKNSYKGLMPFVNGVEVTAQPINKDMLCSQAGQVVWKA